MKNYSSSLLEADTYDLNSVIDASLTTTLAAALAPIEPTPTLHQRLMARVARSVAANAGITTVRAEQGVWRELAPGVRACTLYGEALIQFTLIELAAGAAWTLGTMAQLHELALGPAVHECLVLRGEVQLDAPALGSPVLQLHDYQLIGREAVWLPEARLISHNGARLCWRSSGEGSEYGSTQASHRVTADASGWRPLAPGVEFKRLHKCNGRVSMLTRFEAGATLAAHPHRLGEEGLMAQGEGFLGDVLLREGEFQYAAAGALHAPLFTDVGCVLFVSGAAD